jgi:hypothetical protein
MSHRLHHQQQQQQTPLLQLLLLLLLLLLLYPAGRLPAPAAGCLAEAASYHPLALLPHLLPHLLLYLLLYLLLHPNARYNAPTAPRSRKGLLTPHCEAC